MGNKFNALFATDKEAEKEGVWIEPVPGTRFKVARSGNEKAVKRADELKKQFVRELRFENDKANEILLDIHKKVMAECILVDWEGLEDDDGKDIPYSSGKAYEMLSKEDDFFRFIFGVCTDMDNYKPSEYLEDSEKN